MGDRYRLGIDPGQRYIGLSVVRIPDEGPAEPVYLLVVDLGHGQDHIRHRIQGRAEKRRMRRVRKRRDARLRRIRRLLLEHGVPEDQAARVVALCRRRGWPENAGAAYGAEADSEGLIRVPRERVLAYLRQRIPEIAPSVDRGLLEQVLEIVNEPPRGGGVDNRRVGRCGVEGCHRNRTVSLRYPILWLATTVLPNLQGKSEAWAAARKAFVDLVASEGLHLWKSPLKAFRARSRGEASQRRSWERAYTIIRRAWQHAIAAAQAASNGVQGSKAMAESIERRRKQVERLLAAARRQIQGKSPPTRLAFCPEHLREHVERLATGDIGLEGGAGGRMHSLFWEAVCAKLRSFLSWRLRECLPAHVQIESIVLERAAFDLVRMKGRSSPKEQVLNEARWLGPYGQLRRHWERLHGDRKPTELDLLALETGGLCAYCGQPLGDVRDRGHLVAKDKVGGYPYLGIVATHPTCNQLAWKTTLKVAPAVVEEFRKLRDELLRRDGFVHAWIDAKYGILSYLSRTPEGADDPIDRVMRVERFLSNAFSTMASTMQGAGPLAEAVKEAVKAAGKAVPHLKVARRAATEVARARWAALDSHDTVWFDKELDKEAGGILNHAIDAFLVAALPPAIVLGKRAGRLLWGIHPFDLEGRLERLRSEESWQRAAEQAWEPLLTVGESVNIYDLTLRRVWRQAYARDTRMSLRVPRKGVSDKETAQATYRMPAQKWLEELKKKNTPAKVLDYVNALQFEPLRQKCIQAVQDAGANPAEQHAAVRRTVVEFLKASVKAGLAGGLSAPSQGHPAREERIRQLRAWVESGDIDQPIPVWIGLRVIDRFAGGNAPRIPVLPGPGRAIPDGRPVPALNLETWALETWVLALRERTGGILFEIRPDGRLRPLTRGAPQVEVSWQPSIAGVTSLPPGCPKWRAAVREGLGQAGFRAAWLVGRGSVLMTTNGVFWIRRGLKKVTAILKSNEFQRNILPTVVGARRAIRLL